MSAVLIVLAASGWTAVVWLLATRRAVNHAAAPAPLVRPDFSMFADDAERAGLPSSAAMYRSMDEAWPAPERPQLVRDVPARDRLPAPSIDREDVERLHGVCCYKSKRPSRYDVHRLDDDPWAGTCICHHAVWHSCPDPKAGERIFNALPSRGVRAVA